MEITWHGRSVFRNLGCAKVSIMEFYPVLVTVKQPHGKRFFLKMFDEDLKCFLEKITVLVYCYEEIP